MKTLEERIACYLSRHLPDHAEQNAATVEAMKGASDPFQAMYDRRAYGLATLSIAGNIKRLYDAGKLPGYDYKGGGGRPPASKNVPKAEAENRRMRREVMEIADKVLSMQMRAQDIYDELRYAVR